MNILKKIAAALQRIIDAIRGKKKRRTLYGPGVDPERAARNETEAVARIRRTTHPDFDGAFGELEQHIAPGTYRIGNMWVIAGDIAGYYNSTRKRSYTFHNPANPADYSDDVQIHEAAHHKEEILGLIPPWHNVAWRRLFIFWHIVAVAVKRVTHATQSTPITLPGVNPGDIISIDTALSGGMLAQADAAGQIHIPVRAPLVGAPPSNPPPPANPTHTA